MNNLIRSAVNRSNLTYLYVMIREVQIEQNVHLLTSILCLLSMGSLNFDYRLNDHQALLVAVLYHYLRNGITA